jgi:hypothetical protein
MCSWYSIQNCYHNNRNIDEEKDSYDSDNILEELEFFKCTGHVVLNLTMKKKRKAGEVNGMLNYK